MLAKYQSRHYDSATAADGAPLAIGCPKLESVRSEVVKLCRKQSLHRAAAPMILTRCRRSTMWGSSGRLQNMSSVSGAQCRADVKESGCGRRLIEKHDKIAGGVAALNDG
jgi:hypothetical protein